MTLRALTVGDLASVKPRGFGGRSTHPVTGVTEDHITVAGRTYRRDDGREYGSAVCAVHCWRIRAVA